MISTGPKCLEMALVPPAGGGQVLFLNGFKYQHEK